MCYFIPYFTYCTMIVYCHQAYTLYKNSARCCMNFLVTYYSTSYSLSAASVQDPSQVQSTQTPNSAKPGITRRRGTCKRHRVLNWNNQSCYLWSCCREGDSESTSQHLPRQKIMYWCSPCKLIVLEDSVVVMAWSKLTISRIWFLCQTRRNVGSLNINEQAHQGMQIKQDAK
jgi:hypothetical protein